MLQTSASKEPEGREREKAPDADVAPNGATRRVAGTYSMAEPGRGAASRVSPEEPRSKAHRAVSHSTREHSTERGAPVEAKGALSSPKAVEVRAFEPMARRGSPTAQTQPELPAVARERASALVGRSETRGVPQALFDEGGRRGAPSARTEPNMPAVGARAQKGGAAQEVSEWQEEFPTDPGRPEKLMGVLDRVVLVRMEGAEAGRAYEITGASATIGRSLDNDIIIEDSSVSRAHARIVIEASSVLLEDLGSQNSTFVQGEPIARVELQTGDTIQLGAHAGFSFQRLNAAQLRLFKQLYDSSTKDGLTGVVNRKHFNDRMTGEVAFARRHGSDLGLVMLDIDHFKRVNDEYGHPAGDAVLRQVANHMAKRVRAEDLFARIGGEEFAVVLRGIDTEGCYRLAERLRASLAALPVHVGDKMLAVTVSLGCASLHGAEVSAHVLMAMADERLYEAKRLGRNRSIAAGFGSPKTPA